MHPSATVANRLLQLAWQSGRSLTPMQLLKLVFLCHGWMLGLYGRALIQEPVQAWKYGPVIPDLYRAIKRYRNGPVTAQLAGQAACFDELEADLVRQVFDLYGAYDGRVLSSMTHETGSPWDQTWVRGERGLVISEDVIRDYYGELARRAAN